MKSEPLCNPNTHITTDPPWVGVRMYHRSLWPNKRVACCWLGATLLRSMAIQSLSSGRAKPRACAGLGLQTATYGLHRGLLFTLNYSLKRCMLTLAGLVVHALCGSSFLFLHSKRGCAHIERSISGSPCFWPCQTIIQSTLWSCMLVWAWPTMSATHSWPPWCKYTPASSACHPIASAANASYSAAMAALSSQALWDFG